MKNYVKEDSLRTDEEAMKWIGVSEKYWYGTMENSERWFAKNYPEKITWIDRNRKDRDGRTLPTNDYVSLANGLEYELKSPTTKRLKNISSSISSAAKKGKTRFMINLQDKKISKKIVENLQEYNIRHDIRINEIRLYSRVDGERVIELLE